MKRTARGSLLVALGVMTGAACNPDHLKAADQACFRSYACVWHTLPDARDCDSFENSQRSTEYLKCLGTAACRLPDAGTCELKQFCHESGAQLDSSACETL